MVCIKCGIVREQLMIGIRRNKKRKRVEGAKKLAQSIEKM
jgi:hypothetical protein